MLNTNYYGGSQFGTSQYPQGYTQPYTTPYYQATQPKYSAVTYASEEEIKGYILQPNTQAWAIDRERPFFYIKTADNLGRSTLTKYKFEEFTEAEQATLKTEYLTKGDIAGLANDLETLKTRFKTLEEKISKPKVGGANEPKLT